MSSLYRSIYPVKYLRDYLSQDIRPDGRDFLAFRPISINVSSITHADSSAVFKIGNTTVVCGIKAELSVPRAETPDKGYLIPNIGLTPICSPKFRPGPPSDQAQVTSKLIDGILRDSELLDLTSLCICRDKLVWVLYCDVECISCDGSILDACIGALTAALATQFFQDDRKDNRIIIFEGAIEDIFEYQMKNYYPLILKTSGTKAILSKVFNIEVLYDTRLTLPEVSYNAETGSTTVHPTKRNSISIRSLIACTTFAVFDDDLLIADPTEEEESQALAHFTIVMDKEDLCCVLKPGGVPISLQLFTKSLTKARKRAERVRELIDTAIAAK